MDYLLMRIRQGLLTVPPETDIVLFQQHDGKPPEPALPTANESPSVAETLTLSERVFGPFVLLDDVSMIVNPESAPGHERDWGLTRAKVFRGTVVWIWTRLSFRFLHWNTN